MDSGHILSGGLVGAIGTICTILLGTVGVAFRSISHSASDMREQLKARNEDFVTMARNLADLQFRIGKQEAEITALRTELNRLKALTEEKS